MFALFSGEKPKIFRGSVHDLGVISSNLVGNMGHIFKSQQQELDSELDSARVTRIDKDLTWVR